MPIAIQDTPHALLTELSIILCKTIATWWALRSELDTYATTASNPLCVATTTGVFIKDMGKTTQTVPYPFVSPTPHCLIAYCQDSHSSIQTAGPIAYDLHTIYSYGIYFRPLRLICHRTAI